MHALKAFVICSVLLSASYVLAQGDVAPVAEPVRHKIKPGKEVVVQPGEQPVIVSCEAPATYPAECYIKGRSFTETRTDNATNTGYQRRIEQYKVYRADSNTEVVPQDNAIHADAEERLQTYKRDGICK